MKTVKSKLMKEMPYLYLTKKKTIKKKGVYFKKERCAIKKCKEKVKGIYHCKPYCQLHFNMEMNKDKYKPNWYEKWN